MSANRIHNKRFRGLNPLSFLDDVVRKTDKVLESSNRSEIIIHRLLDSFEHNGKRWRKTLTAYRKQIHNLEKENKRLKSFQEHTKLMFENEYEKRRRLERCKVNLERQLDTIRQVLNENDVDRAKKHLENINNNAWNSESCIRNSNGFDCSNGSLLDPDNVSLDSEEEISKAKSGADEGSRMSSSMSKRPVSSNRISSHNTNEEFIGSSVSFTDRRKSKYRRSSSVPQIPSVCTMENTYLRKNDANLAHCNSFSDSEQEPEVVPTHSKDGEKESPNVSEDYCFGVDFGNRTPHDYIQINNNSNTPLHSNAADTPASLSGRLIRPHEFISRTALWMEVCSACGRRIAFSKPCLKCTSCRLVIHNTCRGKLVQLCVPSYTAPYHGKGLLPSPFNPADNAMISDLHTPQKNASPLRSAIETRYHAKNSSERDTPSSKFLYTHSLNLASLCPPFQYPQIPALVIHCVTEIAARGLETLGLYRMSGSEKQVKELFEKFLKNRSTPSLALVDDIHVICGCLKLFLRSLTEPLVTVRLRHEFVRAGEYLNAPGGDSAAGNQIALEAIDSLPPANKDTLAFILLHLQTIATSPLCHMGVENLAVIFGPTLIGYSSQDNRIMETVLESTRQRAAVRLLLTLPSRTYTNILEGSPATHTLPISIPPQGSTYFMSPMTPCHQLHSTNAQLPLTPQQQSFLSPKPQRMLQTPVSASRRRFFPSLRVHREVNTESEASVN